jgi:hypothetical protein
VFSLIAAGNAWDNTLSYGPDSFIFISFPIHYSFAMGDGNFLTC